MTGARDGERQAIEIAAAIPHHSKEELAAIRDQLERMLAHPLFRNSRRYPALFRHIVEASLQEPLRPLRERRLGVEVFGREPQYDTNQDPIVRLTAGEIRKRIAQYYHSPDHADEIRIDLPSGTYTASFHFPATAEPATPIPLSPASPDRPEAISAKPDWRMWAPILAVVLVALFAWQHPWRTANALDEFWSPVVHSPSPVLLCVAGPFPAAAGEQQQAAAQVTPRLLNLRNDSVIALSDAMTLARITGILAAKGAPYRFRDQRSTDLSDLRQGPVILIGGFNNGWSLRLTSRLRFALEMDFATRTGWIKDRLDPNRRDWLVNFASVGSAGYESQDYALVSRVQDPDTGRMLVAAEGIYGYGTAVAGEFLSDPQLMAQLASRAPAHWERKSIQVVLATKIINGSPGAPRVVAADFR